MLPRIRVLYRFISALRPPFAKLGGNRKWRNARGKEKYGGCDSPSPQGQRALSAVTVTRGKINCRISAFSSYSRVFFLHFTRHRFPQSSIYIVSRTFTQWRQFIRVIYIKFNQFTHNLFWFYKFILHLKKNIVVVIIQVLYVRINVQLNKQFYTCNNYKTILYFN